MNPFQDLQIQPSQLLQRQSQPPADYTELPPYTRQTTQNQKDQQQDQKQGEMQRPTYTVELRAGKLVANCQILTGDQILPGDSIAFYENKDVVLIKRKEQTVIGVIANWDADRNICVIVLPTFGPSCPFRIYLTKHADWVVGGRLVLRLLHDGTIDYKSYFPPDPKFDVPCILSVYKDCTKPASLSWVRHPDATTNHYTLPTVQDETGLDTFTIDPAGSVDRDDAISVDIPNRTIYIHIVDIAAAALSEEDQQCMRDFCTSLYLANEHTEHLLTSVDHLSLDCDQKRDVITVRVRLNEDGVTVESYDIYRSRIVVKRAYTYTDVDTSLLTSSSESVPDPRFVWLAELANRRSSTLNYSITLPSVRLAVDPATGETLSIGTEDTTTPAHSLVATAMILTNIVVSHHLLMSRVLVPQRFHAALHGINTRDISKTGNPIVDSFITVKRSSQARYSIDKHGHFGLGLDHYVHFTSPMRRYADVIVHKLLAGWQIQPPTEVRRYIGAGVMCADMTCTLEDEVEWINWTTRRNKALQQLYVDWKISRWLVANAKRSLDVYCTGVSRTGVQWFVPALSIAGYTHVSQLQPAQYWTLKEGTSLVGASGAVFEPGTYCIGRVVSVIPEIQLSLSL